MSTYREYLDKIYETKHEGIFYAFSDEQYKRGLEACGYDETTKLYKDGFGGFGTAEAFKKRDEFNNSITEEIKKNCTPEEIFKFEYWNHECGYTGDYSEALEITQIYFKDYIPSAKLLTQLYRQGE